ncbi:FAD-dependent thymidylate synthase [Campylobacter sp. MOP7]|uniref:FAD-dependent thymidylate synthase n=1 Tax=Campylobacter canis TaxID=3378588 RepID=UPI00387E71F0
MIVKLLDKKTNPRDTDLSCYCFEICGIAEFILKELAKYKGAELNIKSSECAFKELENEAPFVEIYHINDQERRRYHYDRAAKYIDLLDQQFIGKGQLEQLEYLREEIKSGTSIDRYKFLLTGAYKCDLVWSVNLSVLKIFLKLHLNKSAHFRIRELAHLVFQALPQEDKDLLWNDESYLLVNFS